MRPSTAGCPQPTAPCSAALCPRRPGFPLWHCTNRSIRTAQYPLQCGTVLKVLRCPRPPAVRQCAEGATLPAPPQQWGSVQKEPPRPTPPFSVAVSGSQGCGHAMCSAEWRSRGRKCHQLRSPPRPPAPPSRLPTARSAAPSSPHPPTHPPGRARLGRVTRRASHTPRPHRARDQTHRHGGVSRTPALGVVRGLSTARQAL